MLQSLGKGKINEFQTAIAKHQDYLSRFPAVTKEMVYLNQKVRIIAFLELLFACSSDEMQVPFARIAATCNIEKDDVELLVMKAQSLELIRGSIDQVSQTVQVDWVMPRYLQKEHLRLLAGRLDEWGQKMENVIRLVENGSGDLLEKQI